MNRGGVHHEPKRERTPYLTTAITNGERGSSSMNKTHLVLAVAIMAIVFVFDAAIPTPAFARWKDFPNSGYCPVGTCNLSGGWRALNVRNCRPANCWRYGSWGSR
jgi:hypothetical protein